jgi:hypothetical protein
MVSGSVNGRDPVNTRWKAFGDSSSQNVVDSDSIKTLKEGKDFGIQDVSRVERRHLLHGDMTVTPDDTTDQLLRSAEVCSVRVHERSGIQVVDLEGDVERGVSRNGVKVFRGDEFGARHVVNGRDIAHRGWVARACLDLNTIGNGLADTEVDEIVRANKGVYVAVPWCCCSVDVLDYGWVQCEAGGWVAAVLVVIVSFGRGRRRGEHSGARLRVPIDVIVVVVVTIAIAKFDVARWLGRVGIPHW